MRITSKQRNPLSRQVTESVNIEEAMIKEGECLNTRSEWAGSKIPGLRVKVPKGTMSKVEHKRQWRGRTEVE